MAQGVRPGGRLSLPSVRALLTATLLLMLPPMAATAQDALVIGTDVDVLERGMGGGVSALWVRDGARHTPSAGGAVFHYADVRWAYASLGDTYRLDARTALSGSASLGAGRDADGAFSYVLVRAGGARELLPSRLFGEIEWLQMDVARQRHGIVRGGGTWLPRKSIALRLSLYQSLFGDRDVSLVSVRADKEWDGGDVAVIAGINAGESSALAQPLLADGTSIREAFAGLAFGHARAWTTLISAQEAGDEHRVRLSVVWKLPFAF